jgi:ATP-binding cassette subfamily F protein 3
MHLLSLVADRLWLVRDGTVQPYEGDLDSYRAMLLGGDDTAKTGRADKPAAKAKRPSRDAILALRQNVRKCEERVEKLNEMRDRIATKLADPAMYEEQNASQAAVWNKKYSEVMDGLDRAETLWMAALERLEKAGG